MKLNEFKTEYSFRKWFYEKENYKKFPFINVNIHWIQEPIRIARLTNGNDSIGLVVFSQWDENDMYISLFEIQKKYRRKGYGNKMINMLLEENKPKLVLLEYCDEDSKRFWKSLGFHRRIKYAVEETEMYKKCSYKKINHESKN